MLTYELAHELVDYFPETGKLFWKKRGSHLFDKGRYGAEWAANRWNSQNAGNECFTSKRRNSYFGTLFGKPYQAHRFIHLWMTGGWPKFEIDHINGDYTDNRWANLRDATKSQNQRNKGLSSNNSSGIIGVHFCRHTNRWRAMIYNNLGKQIGLGQFETKESAATARKFAEKLYEYHENHGRVT